MAWRLFIVPMVQIGGYRGPKYFPWRGDPGAAELAGIEWGMMDYGAVPWCILSADTTENQQTFLEAQSDVRAAPADLNTAIGGGNVTALRNYLEAADIPATWITGGDTWLMVLRVIGGLFQFAQLFTDISNGSPLLPPGTDKNTTMDAMGQVWKDTALATAASFNPPYDVSGITGSTTVRAALKILADQWGNKPLDTGGIII